MAGRILKARRGMMAVAAIVAGSSIFAGTALAEQGECDAYAGRAIRVLVTGYATAATDLSDPTSLQLCAGSPAAGAERTVTANLNAADAPVVEQGDACLADVAGAGCEVRSFQVVIGEDPAPAVEAHGAGDYSVEVVRTCVLAVGQACD